MHAPQAPDPSKDAPPLRHAAAKPAGLILAGGRGSRMGGAVAKPLVVLAGKPMIAHVVAALTDLCAPLVVNAGAHEAYDFLGLPLVADRRPGALGPLAGIEAGLAALAETADCGTFAPTRQSPTAPPTHCLVVPADTPFLTADLLATLLTAAAGAERPAVAMAGRRLQPTVGLWPLAWRKKLTAWLDAGGPLAIRQFLDATGFDAVPVGDPGARRNADAARGADVDPFLNVNTPDDLALANRIMAQWGS